MKYKEAFEISKAFGAGLVKHGVQNATFVCIFSENRPEWILTMDASYLYGYVTVALYDTFTTDALEFSIQNCKAKYIVCSKKNLIKLMTCSDETLKQFELVVFFDEVTEDIRPHKDRLANLGVNLLTFEEVRKEGEGSDVQFPEIDPEQLLYVCYSSGTTGFPKGVMISHRSFITNLVAISSEGSSYTFTRHLCYLPLCHVFERMCTSCALLNGGRVGTFSGDVRLLSEDLRSLSPTVMIVVPRVLHRMHDAVMNEVNKKGIIMRTLFNAAWYLKRLCLIKEYGFGLVDTIVFNKIKRVMGALDIEQIVNGGAALPADLHENMQVLLGVPIRTGYGLSEGGSGNTLNPFKMQHIKYGTNGYPLSNVEVRIVKVPEFTDPGVGEIQMGGTCLCSGYLYDEEATKNLFTDETHTWIHTGDIGKWDEQNSLLVVDRMRSIFKLSQGEYVAGDLLATYFETSPLIEHIFVYGDSTRPYLVGIVIPAIPEVARFLNKGGMSDEEIKAACESKQLNDAIMAQIAEVSKEKKLLGYQRINSICIKHDEWTIDNGILSPTFKPKRKVLAERYKKEIDALYAAKK
ncbi:Fatty acyl-CoA synthetase B [Tritrichomonas foetus]|uniref:Fatty acyl-CoA synthetase B n=1 Tax=Tritrichomonas foetus TaxID=1144522 RepID=A0A1J4JVQ0_9EUKA|nr:Fatty acyl-CoA synthetase B [Tritrichomonas foetus]|eukprot:OHT01612.1 Fatty acyl-CoA synthetase B [Tritrichomonas foetus]